MANQEDSSVSTAAGAVLSHKDPEPPMRDLRRVLALGGNQHPVLKGELEGVLPLVSVPVPRP